MSKIKKNKESNELQYYKSHCNLLEKENAELKAKIVNYEITVSMSGKGVDEKVNDLSLLIKKALISKNMYEKLCNEYKSKITVLDEKIAEMDLIKAGYINKLNKFFKSLFRIFK